MTYCKNNENADKIVSYVVERCDSLNSVYDYLDTLDTKSLSEEDFSDIFDGLHVVVSRNKEKAYMLYALFGHHNTRHYYILNDDELELKNDIWTPPCVPQYSLRYCIPYDKWTWELRDYSGKIPEDSSGDKNAEMYLHIQKKLKFINSLIEITKSAVIRNNNYWHINAPSESFSFLKVATYEKKKNSSNACFVIENSHKKYLLVSGDCILSSVSNHACEKKRPIITTLLSLALPVLEGIDVYTSFDYCALESNYKGSFCYMEAR